MLRERMQYLVNRYFSETCTAEEQKELLQWISEAKDDGELKEILAQTWEQYQPLVQMPDAMSDRIQASFAAKQQEASRVHVLSLRGWAAAAAAILILGAAAFFWQFRSIQPDALAQEQRYKNEVPAGGNKAVLTLGDGTVIDLDSAANGLLTQQGRVKVVKLANGQLAYEMNGEPDMVLFNTMRTPRGGEYNLTLPDGTQVWLNAASSITYPTAFKGNTREVKITGEAYFEVAHDAAKPFTVKVGTMNVEVLGTHFNINAYAGEPDIKTTLIEGAVKVSAEGKNDVLQPGQQAQVTPGGTLKITDDVDTDEVMAWKNGLFLFTDADMPTVMRQLENWYDVHVSYEGQIPVRSFGGGIQRSLPLTKVLSILEENNVKFRIEGRNIIVLK